MPQLLAQTTEADAAKIAERLRGLVEDMAIPVGKRPDAPVVKVTISIGVSARPKEETASFPIPWPPKSQCGLTSEFFLYAVGDEEGGTP